MTQTESLTALPTRRNSMIVKDDSADANLMDSARFEHLGRIAETMAYCEFMPQHLRAKGDDAASRRKSIANCFLVVNQALRQRMDPFAFAAETFVVGGRLGYQGKLVIAIVNSRAKIDGRLSFIYRGEGLERTVTVSGRFLDEIEARTIALRVKDAKTSNDMWTKDPDQKLAYSGAIKWARRHCPEVILGVLTDDDIERIAVVEAASATQTAAHFEQLVREEIVVAETAAPSAQPDPWSAFVSELSTRTMVLDVKRLYDIACGPEATLPSDQHAEAKRLCDARCEAILAARGTGSNPPKDQAGGELFEKKKSASEAGI